MSYWITNASAPRLRASSWIFLVVVLAMVGWITWASPVHAQDPDATCNPTGNDNELLYCVWTVEPRFGGFYLNPDDSTALKIWLTDSEDTVATALAEINRLWGRHFASATALEADYTIGQLKGWFDTVAADPHEKLTGVDLDESANRITLMVASLDDQDTVAEHVAGLGVPAEAVQFEEFQILPPDPVPAAQTSGSSSVAGQRLTAGLDPFVGGGEIGSFPNVWLTVCTASFNVMFVDQDYHLRTGLVTAGHCGNARDDITFSTPRSDDEFPNEEYAISVWNQYRQGLDAQYLQKLPGQSLPLGHGLIARPMTENTNGGNASQSQLTLDPVKPYFRITGFRKAMIGYEVEKVGRTTGWTSGITTRSCVNSYYRTSAGPQYFLCVDQTSLPAAGGDSGGPVFELDQNDNATLNGVLMGSLGIVAPIKKVIEELFLDKGVRELWFTPITPPSVDDMSITSRPLSGDTYQPGEILEITYDFNQPVTLYPGPEPAVIFLAPGGKYPRAHYDARRSHASGDDKLVFTWQVQSELDGGLWIGPGVPGYSASIRNLDGIPLHNSQLEYGRSATIGQKSGGPQMEQGTFATGPVEGNNYQPGETIFVATRWNRPVKVDPDNPPHVLIYMNSSPDGVRAEYNHRLSERWGNRTVAFSYEVQVGDEDDDKLWLGNRNDGTTSLRNAAGITDYSGRPASDTWSPASYSRYGAETPSGPPNVVSSGFVFQYRDGQPVIEQFQPGEVVEYRIRFDRPVRVDQSGLPYVNIGINNRGPMRAHYNVQRTAAIKVASVLSFTYTVQDGDTDNDQVWVGDNNLKNAASISDYAGNAATGGGLGVSLGHNVGDAGAPSVTGMELTSQPLLGATYQPGEVIELTLTTDEPISVDSRQGPYLTITLDGQTARAGYKAGRSEVAGANQMVLTWTVMDGSVDTDGISITGARANGIADYSGNPVNTRWPIDARNRPRHKVGDLGAPVITDVEMSSKAICGGTYRAGETLEFTLTVSEPVTVPAGNEPRLIIRVGDDYRSVAYDRVLSQSAGANQMIFAWEVPAGFEAREGILLGPGSLGDAGSIEDESANPLDPSLHKYWGFDGTQVGGAANYFTIYVSNSTPQAGERVTLTVQLEAGCTGVASYQWQRQFGRDWRDVGHQAPTKEAKFNSPQTVTYRAVVQFISDATVTSEPVSITWR